jgi:hypothetical protein
MDSEYFAATRRQQIEPVLFGPAGPDSYDDLEQWEAEGPSPTWDDLCDAFDCDDEIVEPQPEDGDFWGRPEREEDP